MGQLQITGIDYRGVPNDGWPSFRGTHNCQDDTIIYQQIALHLLGDQYCAFL